MKKERLDQELVIRGLAPSREKGKAMIMAGQVYVKGIKVDKPGTPVKSSDPVEIRGAALPYVSRGGLKLEKALRQFSLDLQGKTVIDVGASTGGFTHCALKEGAGKVYAVDVGYGQLDWELRSDPRVINMERTNARHLTPGDIQEQADIITIDVSFISLEKILPALAPLLKEGGRIIALIKPQFEAGRDKVGKKGVVRDPSVHKEVIARIVSFSQDQGLNPLGLGYSPIKGPEGNIEFLLLLGKGHSEEIVPGAEAIERIVNEAHGTLV